MLVESGIRKNSAYGIWNPGFWNPEYSSRRNPRSTDEYWNPVWNPESTAWNPESKTVHSLTWGVVCTSAPLFLYRLSGSGLELRASGPIQYINYTAMVDAKGIGF